MSIFTFFLVLIGSCSVNLKDAFFSEHDAELPDPTWIDLFHEVPGDGEGALLVSVQVIRKSSPSEIFPPPASIVPATKRAYVEVIALGVRDMTPFKFVPMQCPFLEIQHFAFAEKPVEKAKFKIKVPGRRSSAAASDAVSEELLPRTYMAELKTVLCTKTSKKPNPANPNFL